MRQKERSERDFRVVLMRVRGVPMEKVCEMVDLTPRQVRRIMASWREGALKEDTELAIDAMQLLLETVRKDLKELEIVAANSSIADRLLIHKIRMKQIGDEVAILRDAGISFEGVFENSWKDPDVVREVNGGILAAHKKHDVDAAATETAMDYAMDVLEKWGYGPGSGKDTLSEI